MPPHVDSRGVEAAGRGPTEAAARGSDGRGSVTAVVGSFLSYLHYVRDRVRDPAHARDRPCRVRDRPRARTRAVRRHRPPRCVLVEEHRYSDRFDGGLTYLG